MSVKLRDIININKDDLTKIIDRYPNGGIISGKIVKWYDNSIYLTQETTYYQHNISLYFQSKPDAYGYYLTGKVNFTVFSTRSSAYTFDTIITYLSDNFNDDWEDIYELMARGFVICYGTQSSPTWTRANIYAINAATQHSEWYIYTFKCDSTISGDPSSCYMCLNMSSSTSDYDDYDVTDIVTAI